VDEEFGAVGFEEEDVLWGFGSLSIWGSWFGMMDSRKN
jgi:predicted small integral membrane protein